MTLLDKPNKRGKTLVEFQYGDMLFPSFKRYTDWTSDVPFDGDLYISSPTMAVTLAPETGGLKESPFEMTIKLDGFTDEISDGRPHSPVIITVVQLTELDGAIETQTMFFGRMSRTVRNTKGVRGLILIQAENIKSLLDIPLGMMATHQCQWITGRRGCKIDINLFTSNGSIAIIDGAKVTITGVSPKADRFWHRGYLQYDGLQILVREWVNGTEFQLVKKPPSTWLNKLVKLFPGDDRTIEVCRSRFNNEEHWNGPGYAMPAYNPNIESP